MELNERTHRRQDGGFFSQVRYPAKWRHFQQWLKSEDWHSLNSTSVLHESDIFPIPDRICRALKKRWTLI